MITKSVRPLWNGMSVVALASAAFAQSPVQGSAPSLPFEYVRADIVSDVPGTTAQVDPSMVNAWGVACSNDFEWVADAGSGRISIVDREGRVSKTHIVLPSRPLATEPPSPTGIVINTTLSFYMVEGSVIAPAYVMAATEEGTIAGWNPAFGTSKAFTVVDRSHDGASYKGLAVSNFGGVARLYATDFHNGRVDVFGNAFQPIVTSGAFVDPTLPANYVPFGIQAVGDVIVVTYAYKTNPDDEDETTGVGLGVVSEFSPDGTFVKRIATGGELNAPWGVAAVSRKFSGSADTLVIGNFGDGHLHAFGLGSGLALGPLVDAVGRPIVIEGLWGVVAAQPIAGNQASLYFAAGPGDEEHGLFGAVKRAGE